MEEARATFWSCERSAAALADRLARHLTHRDTLALAQLQSSELDTDCLAWLSAERHVLAPHLCTLMSNCEDLVRLVPSEIITADQCLLTLRNFHSAHAIVRGLQHPVVQLMDKPWASLSSKRFRSWRAAQRLLNASNDWNVYRSVVETCCQREEAFVPLIETHLKSLERHFPDLTEQHPDRVLLLHRALGFDLSLRADPVMAAVVDQPSTVSARDLTQMAQLHFASESQKQPVEGKMDQLQRKRVSSVVISPRGLRIEGMGSGDTTSSSHHVFAPSRRVRKRYSIAKLNPTALLKVATVSATSNTPSSSPFTSPTSSPRSSPLITSPDRYSISDRRSRRAVLSASLQLTGLRTRCGSLPSSPLPRSRQSRSRTPPNVAFPGIQLYSESDSPKPSRKYDSDSVESSPRTVSPPLPSPAIVIPHTVHRSPPSSGEEPVRPVRHVSLNVPRLTLSSSTAPTSPSKGFKTSRRRQRSTSSSSVANSRSKIGGLLSPRHLAAGRLRKHTTTKSPIVRRVLESNVDPSTSRDGLNAEQVDRLTNSPVGKLVGKTVNRLEDPMKKDKVLKELALDYHVVDYVANALEADNHLRTTGIYRKSAESDAVKLVWASFCLGRPEFFFHRPLNPHIWTGALKLYLRELSQPLVPFDAWTEWVALYKLTQDTSGASTLPTGTGDAVCTLQELHPLTAQRVDGLTRLVEALPRNRAATLCRLCDHLARVVELHDVNMMTLHNVAIVWGPTVLRPEVETMETLVAHDAPCGIVEALVAHRATVFRRVAGFHPPRPAHVLGAGLGASDGMAHGVPPARALDVLFGEAETRLLLQYCPAKTLGDKKWLMGSVRLCGMNLEWYKEGSNKQRVLNLSECVLIPHVAGVSHCIGLLPIVSQRETEQRASGATPTTTRPVARSKRATGPGPNCALFLRFKTTEDVDAWVEALTHVQQMQARTAAAAAAGSEAGGEGVARGYGHVRFAPNTRLAVPSTDSAAPQALQNVTGWTHVQSMPCDDVAAASDAAARSGSRMRLRRSGKERRRQSEPLLLNAVKSNSMDMNGLKVLEAFLHTVSKDEGATG